eukprot:2586762-Prymnesium_polylepis.1
MPDASSAAVGVTVGAPGAAATRDRGWRRTAGAAHASQPSTPPEPSTSTGLRSPPDGNAAESTKQGHGGASTGRRSGARPRPQGRLGNTENMETCHCKY